MAIRHDGGTCTVYALNMMLIPVNLGGIAKSVYQGITRRKIPFGRTPKVKGRTSAPALYILCELALLLAMVRGFFWHLEAQRFLYVGFALFHAGFFAYVLLRYMGVRESYADLRQQLAPSGNRLTEVLADLRGAAARAPSPVSPLPPRVRIQTPPSPRWDLAVSDMHRAMGEP